MTPMLVVGSVQKTSQWLQEVFELRSQHGGDEFEMLADASGAVVLWLHAHDVAHDHPQTTDVDLSTVGKGVTFYIEVKDIEATLKRATSASGKIIEALHENPLAHFSEFSVEGPDGYCFAAHTAFGTSN